MSDPENGLAVANRFNAAIAARDADALAGLYAEDIVVGSNSNDDTQDKAENVAMMRVIFSLEREHGYHDIELLPTPDGYVQLHTFRPIFIDGSSGGEARVCLVVKVRDGKIHQLREFIDVSQIAILWEAVAAALGLAWADAP